MRGGRGGGEGGGKGNSRSNDNSNHVVFFWVGNRMVPTAFLVEEVEKAASTTALLMMNL